MLEKIESGPGRIWNPKMIPNRDSKAPMAYTWNQQKQETESTKTYKANNDTSQLVYKLMILIIVIKVIMPCSAATLQFLGIVNFRKMTFHAKLKILSQLQNFKEVKMKVAQSICLIFSKLN